MLGVPRAASKGRDKGSVPITSVHGPDAEDTIATRHRQDAETFEGDQGAEVDKSGMRRTVWEIFKVFRVTLVVEYQSG